MPDIVENPDNRLIDIAYEEITKGYSKGKYLGLDVILNDKGWINVTDLCKKGGKEFKHWHENKSSKELINYISLAVGLPASNLLPSIKGGFKLQIIKGTYAHPKLAPHIASWVSNEFAFKVSDIVNDFVIKNNNKKYEEKIRKIEDEKQDLLTRFEEECKRAEEERRKAEEARRNSKLQFEEICRLNNIIIEKNNKIHNELVDTKTKLVDTTEKSVKAEEKAVKAEEKAIEAEDKVIKVEEELIQVKKNAINIEKEVVNVKKQLNEKSAELEILNEKVDIIAEHNYVPKVIDYDKQEIFIVMVKMVKDPNVEQLVRSKELYIIRAQRKTAYINRNKKERIGYTVVFSTVDPNPGNMLIRARKDLKNIAKFDHNNVKLNDNISVDEFIMRIKNVKDKCKQLARANN